MYSWQFEKLYPRHWLTVREWPGQGHPSQFLRCFFIYLRFIQVERATNCAPQMGWDCIRNSVSIQLKNATWRCLPGVCLTFGELEIFFTNFGIGQKKSRNGDTLGPVELIVWPKVKTSRRFQFLLAPSDVTNYSCTAFRYRLYDTLGANVTFEMPIAEINILCKISFMKFISFSAA